ncbi:PAS domain S-box protein [bacterium]|nr:PAS domain S-box protein [bacterium]
MSNRVVQFFERRFNVAMAAAALLPSTAMLVFAMAVAHAVAGGLTAELTGILAGAWLIAAVAGGSVAWFVGRGIQRDFETLSNAAADLARGAATSPPPNLTHTGFLKMENAIKELGRVVDDKSNVLAEQLRTKFGSELSEEKRRFEAFLRGIGDSVTIVDPEFRIIYVNDTVKKIFGEISGEFCYKAFEHKNEVCGGCPVKKSFETGDVEMSLRRVYSRDDKLLYMENTGSPIRDEKGRIVAGIELARDVTQRIRLERNIEIRTRELASANEELHVANKQLQGAYEELQATQSALFQSEKMASLGVLVAGVAHEINNPINFVYGSMSILEENIRGLLSLITSLEGMPLPDDSKKQLAELKSEMDFDYVKDDLARIVKNVSTGAQRIKAIVQNLRTFSRVDSSENGDVDIHEGIDSTLEILGHELKNRIRVEKDYGNVPKLIGNPGKINQVFMNVLHNAVQAIEGEGVISIRTFVENNMAVAIISDTGAGIAPDALGKIFDPFFTTKRVGEGTGLGLSISYSIIQDHGGRLTAESAVGEGTRFRIELPLRRQVARTEDKLAS